MSVLLRKLFPSSSSSLTIISKKILFVKHDNIRVERSLMTPLAVNQYIKEHFSYNTTNQTTRTRNNNNGKRFYSRDAATNIVHSDLPDIDIPNLSIDEYLFENVDKWPTHVATECAITGRKYTYEQFRNQAINLSRSLRKKLKLDQGETIAILLPNCPEFPIAIIGSARAGLIVTTLNPIYTTEEISRQLVDSGAKCLITLVDLYPLASASLSAAKMAMPVITIKSQEGQSVPNGAINFNELVQNIDYPDLPPFDVDSTAFLPYSSGTTGLPKGVRLSHRNMVANVAQFSADGVSVMTEPTSNSHQDIVPAILPFFHIYGLNSTCMYMLRHGGRVVALPKFTPELYVNSLRNLKPTILFLAPPVVLFLAGHPSVKSEDLASVKTVISGAAPLGSLDEERLLTKAQKDIHIFQGYGLTETSPLVSICRPEFKTVLNKTGTIGRPVPNTSIKIINPDNPTAPALGPKQTGELAIKGPQVMQGYHNRPDANKEIFTEDGWLRTGDLVYYDEHNLLFVADRLKELIKVKGFQVPPAELEELIRAFPDVDDAAVVGIPHHKHGEVPRAYVVPKSGREINCDKLGGYIAEKVAEYKQLRGGIEVVQTIPKNASGKILRRVLKEQYLESIQK